ncbi:unnamed protein product [Soboliphyme baturini]|uniref:Ribosome production factor 2 homolog n=1 Tax=Soboliphyme baturini TaxID=241478 RepID=A0A3P8B1W0_9BILA|nr:unnamed protein product [Soboliphyme baturini]
MALISVFFSSRKPTTKRGKRYLENRAPKLIENDKTCLFIRGNRVSQAGVDLLKDLKYDAALFVFTSHSKKRPNNIIMGKFCFYHICVTRSAVGRLFSHHILDMFEFGIEDFASIASFKNCLIPVGFKPCLSFMGLEFQQDPVYQRLKNLLTGRYLFRGPSVKTVRLQGIEYLLSFSVVDGKVKVRSYRILLKKSDSRVPHVELQSAGPSCDLTLRRNRTASNDLYKSACKTPRAVKVRKTKNLTMDVFGTRLGRIHVKQNLDEIRYTRIKGLKRKRSVPSEDTNKVQKP